MDNKIIIVSFEKDFPVKTDGSLIVYSYDLLNDLLYEVSSQIASYSVTGFIGDKYSLVSIFANERKKDFEDYARLLKSSVFISLSDDDLSSSLTLPFPKGYVEWLRYNVNPVFSEIGKEILNRNLQLIINPREIYEDYIVSSVYPAVDKLIKENPDIKSLSIADYELKNFIVVKDMLTHHPGLVYRHLSDGMIQRTLGLAYYRGLGTEKDYHEALNHFRNAIENNDADSFAYMGQMYESGFGVEEDSKKAFQYYTESSDKNSLIGMSMLGRAYCQGIGTTQNYNKAVEYFLPAAEHGIVMAQESLADIYYEGLIDKPDFDKAFVWYRKAENNHPSKRTLYKLGKMLYEGIGTQKDYPTAYKYLVQSAEDNVEDSCFMCGQILESGDIEDSEANSHIRYYKQGAEHGDYKAATEYALYLKTKGNIQEMLSLLKDASEKGYMKAQFELALFLTDFIKQNYSQNLEAYRDSLLKSSAQQGYMPAVELQQKLSGS